MLQRRNQNRYRDSWVLYPNRTMPRPGHYQSLVVCVNVLAGYIYVLSSFLSSLQHMFGVLYGAVTHQLSGVSTQEHCHWASGAGF